MDAIILHEEAPCVYLLSTCVRTSLKVYGTYTCIVDFSLSGQPYTFTITRWRSKNLNEFLQMFHAYTPHDPGLFGSTSIHDSEGNTTVHMDSCQKVNAVVQGCKDVMGCLDKIAHRYPQSMLDYSIWYQELGQRREDEGYGQFITQLTCHLIEHTGFSAPNVQWDVVEFGGHI